MIYSCPSSASSGLIYDCESCFLTGNSYHSWQASVTKCQTPKSPSSQLNCYPDHRPITITLCCSSLDPQWLQDQSHDCTLNLIVCITTQFKMTNGCFGYFIIIPVFVHLSAWGHHSNDRGETITILATCTTQCKSQIWYNYMQPEFGLTTSAIETYGSQGLYVHECIEFMYKEHKESAR